MNYLYLLNQLGTGGHTQNDTANWIKDSPTNKWFSLVCVNELKWPSLKAHFFLDYSILAIQKKMAMVSTLWQVT